MPLIISNKSSILLDNNKTLILSKQNDIINNYDNIIYLQNGNIVYTDENNEKWIVNNNYTTTSNIIINSEWIKNKYYLENNNTFIITNTNEKYLINSNNEIQNITDYNSDNIGNILLDGQLYKLDNKNYVNNIEIKNYYILDNNNLVIYKNNKYYLVNTENNTYIELYDVNINEDIISIKKNKDSDFEDYNSNIKNNLLQNIDPKTILNYILLDNGNIILNTTNGYFLIEDNNIIKLENIEKINDNSIKYKIDSNLEDSLNNQTNTIKNIKDNEGIKEEIVLSNNSTIIKTNDDKLYLIDLQGNKQDIDSYNIENNVITYNINDNQYSDNLNNMNNIINNLINDNGNIKEEYILDNYRIIKFDNDKIFKITNKEYYELDNFNIEDNSIVKANIISNIEKENNYKSISIIGSIPSNIIDTKELNNGDILIQTNNNYYIKDINNNLINLKDTNYGITNNGISYININGDKETTTFKNEKEIFNLLNSNNEIYTYKTDDNQFITKINDKYYLFDNTTISNINNVYISNKKIAIYNYIDENNEQKEITGTLEVLKDGSLNILDLETNESLLNININSINDNITNLTINNKVENKIDVNNGELVDSNIITINNEKDLKLLNQNNNEKNDNITLKIEDIKGNEYKTTESQENFIFTPNNIVLIKSKEDILAYNYKISNNILILKNLDNNQDIIYLKPKKVIEDKNYVVNLIKVKNGKIIKNYKETLNFLLEDKNGQYFDMYKKVNGENTIAFNYNDNIHTIILSNNNYFEIYNSNIVNTNIFEKKGLWDYRDNILLLTSLKDEQFMLGIKSKNGPIFTYNIFDITYGKWYTKSGLLLNGKLNEKIENEDNIKDYINDNYTSPDLNDTNLFINFNNSIPNKLDISKIKTYTYTYIDPLTGEEIKEDTEIFVYDINGKIIKHDKLKNVYNNGWYYYYK